MLREEKGRTMQIEVQPLSSQQLKQPSEKTYSRRTTSNTDQSSKTDGGAKIQSYKNIFQQTQTRKSHIGGTTQQLQIPSTKAAVISQSPTLKIDLKLIDTSQQEEIKLPLAEQDSSEQESQNLFVKSKRLMLQVVDVLTPKASSGLFQRTQGSNDDELQSGKHHNTLSSFSLKGILKTNVFGNSFSDQLKVQSQLDYLNKHNKEIKKERIEEERKLLRTRQLEENYEKNYGFQTAKIYFLFEDPLKKLGFKSMSKIPLYYEYPNVNEVKNDLIIVRVHNKEQFCFGGSLYKKLYTAFLELVQNQVKAEVEHSLLVAQSPDPIDICIKMKICDKSGLIVKLRKVKNKKKHEYKKILKAELSIQKKSTFARKNENKLVPQKTIKKKKDSIDVNIKSKFKGTQISCALSTCWKDSDGVAILDQELISTLYNIRNKCKQTQQDQIEWIYIRKTKFILAAEVGNMPYILNPLNFTTINTTKQNSNKIFWDYLETFKPPADLSIHKDISYKVEILEPECLEFKYVAYKWASTFHGQDLETITIKNTFKKLASEGNLMLSKKIVKIEKIYNCEMYLKIKEEIQKVLTRSKSKTANDVVRHLFYSNSVVNPEFIYSVNEVPAQPVKIQGGGIQGIYLSDNSHQAHLYSFKIQQQDTKQMFLCLTVLGSSAIDEDNLSGGRLSTRKSQNSQQSGSFNKTSESIQIQDKGRFNFTDSRNVYPGYLITYK